MTTGVAAKSHTPPGTSPKSPGFDGDEKTTKNEPQAQSTTGFFLLLFFLFVLTLVGCAKYARQFMPVAQAVRSFTPLLAHERTHPLGGGANIPFSVYADTMCTDYLYPAYTSTNVPVPYFATWPECPFKYELINEAISLYLIHDVLTPEQIEILKQLPGEKFQDAPIGLNAGLTTGQEAAYQPELRKSQSFDYKWRRAEEKLDGARSEIVNQVTNLVHQLLGISKSQLEHLQIIKYRQYDFFKAHSDQYNPRSHPGFFQNNPRMWTALIYLNTVEKGGSTDFLNIGVSVKAVQGKMVVWYNRPYEDDENDPFKMEGLHQGGEVEEGEKWIVSFFTRQKPFRLRKRNPTTLLPVPASPSHCDGLRVEDPLQNVLTADYFALKVNANGTTFEPQTLADVLDNAAYNALPPLLYNGGQVYVQLPKPDRNDPVILASPHNGFLLEQKYLSLHLKYGAHGFDYEWFVNFNYTASNAIATLIDDASIVVDRRTQWLVYDLVQETWRPNPQLRVTCFASVDRPLHPASVDLPALPSASPFASSSVSLSGPPTACDDSDPSIASAFVAECDIIEVNEPRGYLSVAHYEEEETESSTTNNNDNNDNNGHKERGSTTAEKKDGKKGGAIFRLYAIKIHPETGQKIFPSDVLSAAVGGGEKGGEGETTPWVQLTEEWHTYPNLRQSNVPTYLSLPLPLSPLPSTSTSTSTSTVETDTKKEEPGKEPAGGAGVRLQFSWHSSTSQWVLGRTDGGLFLAKKRFPCARAAVAVPVKEREKVTAANTWANYNTTAKRWEYNPEMKVTCVRPH